MIIGKLGGQFSGEMLGSFQAKKTTGPTNSERIPGRAFVFTDKIQNLGGDWTPEKKKDLKQYAVGHELGHVRGDIDHVNGEEHHTETFGDYWKTCCMHSPVATSYDGLKLTDLDYCKLHAKRIKFNWW